MSFMFESPMVYDSLMWPTSAFSPRSSHYRRAPSYYDGPFGPVFSQHACPRSVPVQCARKYPQNGMTQEVGDDVSMPHCFQHTQKQADDQQSMQKQYGDNRKGNRRRHPRNRSSKRDIEQLSPQDIMEEDGIETYADRQALLRYNHASRVIQHWVRTSFRQILSARKAANELREMKRQDAAAYKITRVVRAIAKKKRAVNVANQLRKLQRLAEEADQIKKEFYDKVFTKPVHDEKGRVSFVLLGYIDQLEKIVTKTDDICTYGHMIIRHRRKTTVKHIQSLLDEVDKYQTTGPQYYEVVPMDLEAEV